MQNILTDGIHTDPHAVGCVFVKQSQNGTVKDLYYNEVASSVVSFSFKKSRKNVTVSSEIAALCLRWKRLLDRKNKENNPDNRSVPCDDVIDIFQSHRRRYAVRGVVMSPEEAKEKQYLFILERVSSDNVTFKKNLRRWKLSLREQEIAQLLIDDRSNKEIARSLSLSVNTVKAYMKLLMLKLGVTSRTGVIARLLTSDK